MVKILTDPGCIAQAGLLVKNAMKPEYPELYPYLKLPIDGFRDGSSQYVYIWCSVLVFPAAESAAGNTKNHPELKYAHLHRSI
jgi:hypothetical protein